jgi:transglutaminase-like putative cysteine protease
LARTLALYPLPALLIVTAWLRLENGPTDSRVLLLLVLAVVPALLRPAWARALAVVAAAAVAAPLALSVSPLEARPFDADHDFFGPLAERFREGAQNFYEVLQPFQRTEHPEMHAVLLVAIFGFCTALALAIAARRPVLAGLLVVSGSVWPATLVPGSDLARGSVTLVAVLVLLAAARERPPRSFRPAAVAVVALAVAALAASTSPAVAKQAFVAWQTWDLYDAPADPVGVSYVWDASYGGIRFPRKKTVVLRVAAPPDSRYWRATTLDEFRGDRWVEQLHTRLVTDGKVALYDEPFLPRRALDDATWVRADVHVEALRDPHLVGGSMPVAVDARETGRVRYLTGNVAVAQEPLRRDADYTVWSFVPHPSPRQLARARAHGRRQPPVARYLELAPGIAAPPFGKRGRERTLDGLFFDRELAPYRPLYQAARGVVGRPRNAYAAVVALEAWFRTEGGFTYEERPPLSLGAPPLVDFVLRTKRGYCQHFAGAMALMLRYLGIPARVGAGFVTGTYDVERSEWTVTDHDAHTWVEVWFPGYGWLPFDPTPSRGGLSGSYTTASRGFDSRDAAAALGAGIFAGREAGSFADRLGQKFANGGSPTGGDTKGDLVSAPIQSEEHRGASLVRLLALLAASAVAALALLKLGVRKSRYLTRDPRRVASACRRELVEFVADQGIEIPRSATIAEAGALVARRLAVDARPFVRAASVTRFAPPDDAAMAARDARRELRRLLRRVRGRVGLLRRVRGTVSLRSLAG